MENTIYSAADLKKDLGILADRMDAECPNKVNGKACRTCSTCIALRYQIEAYIEGFKALENERNGVESKKVVVRVIKYNDAFYVWYKSNGAGFAQLIDETGKKCSGTPSPEKLEVVKEIECKEFNNSFYFNTKIGVFSAVSGDKVSHPKILEMFK